MKFVGVIVAIVLLVLPATVWAAPNTDAGTGAPPVGSGPVSNNVPDSDGKAWDRLPEQHSDDWNNGCQPWHEADDNEGVCGETFSPPTAIITPRRFESSVCKFDLIASAGTAIEVFPSWVDVRNPKNEVYVWFEAKGYAPVYLNPGEEATVLWFDHSLGHGDSQVTTLRCEIGGTTVTIEQPLKPLFATPPLETD